MTPYRIAAYLTEDGKRRAIEAEYVKSGPSWSDVRRRCPMGIAVPEAEVGCPTAWIIATTINPENDDRRIDIEVAANEFIADWDQGRIGPSDLATALGSVEIGDGREGARP